MWFLFEVLSFIIASVGSHGHCNKVFLLASACCNMNVDFSLCPFIIFYGWIQTSVNFFFSFSRIYLFAFFMGEYKLDL